MSTENEDKLLWNPGELASGDVENYLAKSQEAVQSGGVGSLPLGAHVRDDEQVNFISFLKEVATFTNFDILGPSPLATMWL